MLLLTFWLFNPLLVVIYSFSLLKLSESWRSQMKTSLLYLGSYSRPCLQIQELGNQVHVFPSYEINFFNSRTLCVDITLLWVVNVDITLLWVVNVDITLLWVVNVDITLLWVVNVDITLLWVVNVDITLLWVVKIALNLTTF